MIADATRRRRASARPTCSPRPSTGPTAVRSCSASIPRSRAAVAELVAGAANVEVEDVGVARRGARALRRLRARARRALARGRRGRGGTHPQRGLGLRPHLRGRRRLRGGRDARAADARPRARRRRARARGVPQADPVRARERRGARAARARSRCRSRGSRGCRCTRPRWSRDERAAAAARLPRLRLGAALGRGRRAARPAPGADPPLRPEHAAACPGVPQVPLAESFARLNEYPDGTYRELREAAAAYCGVEPGADRGRRRRGRPDRDLRADVPRPRPARGDHAADVLRSTGSRAALEGAEVVDRAGRRRARLGLQPEQPDRRAASSPPRSPRSRRRTRTRRSSSTRPTSSTRTRPACR